MRAARHHINIGPLRRPEVGALGAGGFAEYYPFLRPADRLAALSAAAARGDGADHRRLAATAPRVVFPLPHHLPLALAWQATALLSRCAVLDAAAELWLALARAAEPAGPAERDRRHAELAARSTALVAQAAAWRALGREHGVVAARREPSKRCHGPRGRLLALSRFARNRSSPDGHLRRCRDCEKQRVAAYDADYFKRHGTRRPTK